jgi:hypothetical protein
VQQVLGAFPNICSLGFAKQSCYIRCGFVIQANYFDRCDSINSAHSTNCLVPAFNLTMNSSTESANLSGNSLIVSEQYFPGTLTNVWITHFASFQDTSMCQQIPLRKASTLALAEWLRRAHGGQTHRPEATRGAQTHSVYFDGIDCASRNAKFIPSLKKGDSFGVSVIILIITVVDSVWRRAPGAIP